MCRTGTARRQTLARRGSKGFRLQTWHSGATIGRILTTRSQCDLVLFHHRKPNARCKMGAQGNLDYFGSKTLQQMQLVRIGSDRSCEVCFRLMVFLDSIWSFPVWVVIQCHTNQIWPDKISSKPNFDLVYIFQKFKILVKGLGSGKFLKAFLALNKRPAKKGIKNSQMHDFQISILLLEDHPYVLKTCIIPMLYIDRNGWNLLGCWLMLSYFLLI